LSSHWSGVLSSMTQLHWWLRFESDGVGESRGGLYAQVDRAFARVVRSFDGGTASGCVGLPTEIVGHPLPLYRHRHGVFSSSSLALLLLARFFSCASPLFLVSLLPYYDVHISAVTWCARIIIQTGITVCLVSIGRCGSGRSFFHCSSLKCNFC
jgi:hypothetical protein